MKNKVTISKLFFYVAYIIWMITYILNQTYYREVLSLDIVCKIVRIIVYTILFIKVLYDNIYNAKTMFAIIFIALLLVISFNSGISILIDIFLFIYSVRNLNIRNVIKLTLFIQIFMMGFIIISSYYGIIVNDIWYRDDGGIRYGLGYTYCTFIANYYFHIILMYLYLKDEREFTIWEVIIILFINYIIYTMTDTRAVFYLISLTSILAYSINFLKNPLKNGMFNKLIFKYCFPISAIFSIVISINYNISNPVYVELNKLLSGRLALGKNAYEIFNISLLGQKINWITGRVGIERSFYEVYNFVDSSYLNIAINYGIIILALICIGFVLVGKYAIENNKKYICLLLLVLAIHSISDPQLIQLEYHPFLLTFGIFFKSSFKYHRSDKIIFNLWRKRNLA